MSRRGTFTSTWDMLEAMDWDNSDATPVAPTAKDPRRPPPTPIKVKDASGRPVRQQRGLPGVHEEVPGQPGANRRSGVPDRRRFDKPTRQLFVPNSFDVTVPGEGTFRVPAASAEEAKSAIVTWFAEDQEQGGAKHIDPNSLQVVRTAQNESRRALRNEEGAWNVRNLKTGQVFSHIQGASPDDAKRNVLASNPLLGKIDASQLEVRPMGPSIDANKARANLAGQPQSYQDRAPSTSFDDGDDGTTLANPPAQGSRDTQPMGSRSGYPRQRGRFSDTEADAPSIPSITSGKARMRDEGASAGAMGANGPIPRDQMETVRAAVLSMVREIVRKKPGGGGYALYAPNKGKKKRPKPVGEFPTRIAAKKAELARFPPKDPEALKNARERMAQLDKDPKKKARIEKQDLSGRKRARKTGAPARDRKHRKESFVRVMAQDLHERLFHEDEVPGSPWDEHMASLHPDAISSDRKLHQLHRGMEKASIGALGDAHKGLSKVLRGVVKVNPGDIAFDSERKKTFMPVMLDCDGMEIGPVHMYVDGGHIKIEVSREAREAISQLEPDTARELRGGLMSFEEDHLPRIDGAQKAWAERDRYLDKLHGRLEKHAAGLSGVEHHLMKGLLTKGGKRK